MANLKTSHNSSLNLLSIEDSIDDFELIVHELQREGLIINAHRVETPEAFEASLCGDTSWDIIISDNTLPRFNAISALRLTRDKNFDIPFIIVSGTIDENSAINAMRAGAQDYLLKDNLQKLAPVVNREIKEYRGRKRRRVIEQRLQESQEYYKLLAENVQDLVCVHSATGAYVWVSPSAKKILGLSPNELQKIGPHDRIHEADKPLVARIYHEIQAGDIRQMIRYKYRRQRTDGVWIHLETIAEPVYTGNQLSKIVTTTRDITEEVLANQLLKESQATNASILESLSEGIILLDANGNINSYNHSATQLLSLSKNEDRNFVDWLYNEYRIIDHTESATSPADFPSQLTLTTGNSQFGKVLGFCNFNKCIWLSLNSVPFPLNENEVGVVLSFNDLTAVQENERKTTKLAEELVTMIETANAPIFGIDWSGNTTEWNQFTATITGFSKDEIMGQNLMKKIIPVNYRTIVSNLFKKILRGENIAHYELPIQTKDGKLVTILFSGTCRRDHDGHAIGLLCVGQDITELTEYRERLELKVEERTTELKKALEKQKELVALKSKFVSMASHEFRTPLATIRFASDFVQKYYNQVEWPKVETKLHKINEQVKHMTYLLDDVLIMGKSQAGKIRVNVSDINIRKFILQLISEISDFTRHSHEIDCHFTLHTEQVQLDEKLLRNIILNLLSNAVKFSPGKKSVKVYVITDHTHLIINVKDYGMGIKKMDHEVIFDAFHRSSNAEDIQGTGLGLSIVKKAIELQDGEISLESDIGIGTTFRVKLPIR